MICSFLAVADIYDIEQRLALRKPCSKLSKSAELLHDTKVMTLSGQAIKVHEDADHYLPLFGAFILLHVFARLVE